MAILDEIDKKISQLGQNAIKKTKDMSESVKISAALREEEDKQTQLYRKIGEYIYENCQDTADGQIKIWCADIMASKAQMLQYKERLKMLKGAVICSNCGAAVSSDSVFCNACGARIEERKQEKVDTGQFSAGRTCPNCGISVGKEALFCISCGTKLVKGDIDEKKDSTQDICTECGETRSEILY